MNNKKEKGVQVTFFYIITVSNIFLFVNHIMLAVFKIPNFH